MAKSVVMRCLLVLVAVACLVGPTRALIHDLKVEMDFRSRFFIENFGFETGGVLNLTVISFSLHFPANRPPPAADELQPVGFLIKKSNTDTARFLEETEQRQTCLLLDTDVIDPVSDSVLLLTNVSHGRLLKKIPSGHEGFYNVYFVNCNLHSTVNFEALLAMYNRGPSYLPIGQIKLPTMYSVVFLAYAALLILWVGNYMRNDEGKRVLHIHYLMTVLLVLKMVSAFFHAVELHFLNIEGHPGGWALLYFFFTTLKGMMLFIVILLIGTGWSFVKPFLSDQDKKIFMIVLPLQLLDNLAMVIIEETAPGSQGFFTWTDIFRLVDIICCGAILIPIIWSIHHLKSAGKIDGKVARNIHKLKLFRHFYLLVVSYIYFTRVIVYLLDATLPFRAVWLGDFFTEIATLIFYITVGYNFRPEFDNPYFQLAEEDLIFDTLEPDL